MDAIKRIVANTVSFVILYLLLMTPTYILPYFGSNSVVINAANAAGNGGVYALLLVHLAFLAALVVLTWTRGSLIQKTWLVGLPIAAGMFDIVPGLSLIPLAPTVLHLATIIVGVRDERASAKA